MPFFLTTDSDGNLILSPLKTHFGTTPHESWFKDIFDLPQYGWARDTTSTDTMWVPMTQSVLGNNPTADFIIADILEGNN